MPSAKVLESKQARVEELAELLKNSVSVVLVDYKGITVEQDTALRKNLREANVKYFVEKNTLLKRAFNANGVTDFDEVLNGTTAVAVSADDQTAPARILGEFAEKSETFKLKAGSVEGEFYDENHGSVQDSVQGRSACTARRLFTGSDSEARCCTAGCCGQKRRSCIRMAA